MGASSERPHGTGLGGRSIAAEGEVYAEVRRIFGEELGRPGPIDPSLHLDRDLQLDSVERLTLVVGLEDRFRVALREEDAAQVHTLGDLVRLVAARRSEAQAEGATSAEGRSTG